MAIAGRYQIVVETDEVGGYRAIIDDWYTRAGRGNTPLEAIQSAIEYAAEWLSIDETLDDDGVYDDDMVIYEKE